MALAVSVTPEFWQTVNDGLAEMVTEGAAPKPVISPKAVRPVTDNVVAVKVPPFTQGLEPRHKPAPIFAAEPVMSAAGNSAFILYEYPLMPEPVSTQ